MHVQHKENMKNKYAMKFCRCMLDIKKIYAMKVDAYRHTKYVKKSHAMKFCRYMFDIKKCEK